MTLGKHRRPIAERERQGDVVQHHGHRSPALRKTARHGHELEARRGVEVGRRFVHHDDARLLGKHRRQKHALPLASRQARHVGSSMLQASRLAHGVVHDFVVARRGRRQGRPMRIAPAHDELLGAHARHADGLPQHRHVTRDFLAAHVGDITALNHNLPGTRRELAVYELDRRGLAAAVGAQNRRDLAATQGQIHVFEDGPLAVGERHPAQLHSRRIIAAHRSLPLPRTTSHTKNGPPTNAIRMPTASS